MNANLYALFESRFPLDRSALFLEKESGECFSYADLERQTAYLAAFLTGAGVARGERVAVQVEKTPQALFLYLACLRAGLVYLPLNNAYSESEVDYFLQNAEPKVVVAQPSSIPWLVPLVARLNIPHLFTLDENGQGSLTEAYTKVTGDFVTVESADDDLAAILYTSGTTGRSKGAMLTHKNLSSNALTLHRLWGFTAHDVLLHALPLFHVHGLFVACHCALLNGSAMIFHRKFDARAVMRDLLRATVFMGVPHFLHAATRQGGFWRGHVSQYAAFHLWFSAAVAGDFQHISAAQRQDASRTLWHDRNRHADF